jgi:hypothetical protein
VTQHRELDAGLAPGWTVFQELEHAQLVSSCIVDEKSSFIPNNTDAEVRK